MQSLARREPTLPADCGPEAQRAYGIAMLERDIGEQHGGIQNLIEVRGAGCLAALIGAHAPATVDQHRDTLIARVLELAQDGLASRWVAFQSMCRTGSP